MILTTGKPKTVSKSRRAKENIMAVKHVDLDDVYDIKTSTNDVFVDVTIGDGQVGSYSVFLGRDLIKSNAPANIGKRSDIDGKNTIVTVAIVDTLKSTNWTSITIKVTEGGTETVYGPYKAMAEKHLDTVMYSLKLINQ